MRGPTSAIAALLALTGAAAADPIIWLVDEGGQLGQVDVATGAVIGAVSLPVVMTDIAFRPTGTLYGVSFTNFYAINPDTGSLTTNLDAVIDVIDLVNVILLWGGDGQLPGVDADLDDNGTVDVADLVIVVLGWGPCR